MLTECSQVVADLAFVSEEVSRAMYTTFLVSTLMQLAGSNVASLKCAALLAIGNLAFEPTNRRSLLSQEGLRELLSQLADGHKKGGVTPRRGGGVTPPPSAGPRSVPVALIASRVYSQCLTTCWSQVEYILSV
jgi:hypothetical protein